MKTKPNVDFYTDYFSLIADGARLKLVEAMFGLNLFALFENNTCILECDLIETLQIQPNRAKKWLHLLCCEHFLKKVIIDNQPAYQLPDELRQLMHGEEWWGMQFFFNSWIGAANEDLADVLSFGQFKTNVTWSWPPKTKDQAIILEEWMRKTADWTIRCTLEHINFNHVNHLLDVGGGDGTMACAFVSAHPHLKATVYNLPESAELARKNIETKGLSHRVSVLEGNFIEDETFPAGFDLILFARVLLDWDENVNRKLLTMAYQALQKNSLVAICEIFKEDNNDLCLACEYRYIFLDDFAVHVFKTEAEYRCMLEEIGFSILPSQEKTQPYCSFLLAQK